LSPAWGLTGNEKFTIGSCYLKILNTNRVTINAGHNWKWMWSLKLPACLIYFIWLVKNEIILCNQMCVRRGISQEANCKACGLTETQNHIFRECFKAKKVWNLVLGTNVEDHVDVNFFIWLDANLSSKANCTNRVANWSTIFAVTLWNLWKMRNDLQFNDIVICENSVARNSLTFANDIAMAFNRGTKDDKKGNETLIKWFFPPAGCIKINTDGSSSNEGSCGSFGGLVRTDQGKWVEGFCGYIGYADALTAELWGIRHAFKMCKDRN